MGVLLVPTSAGAAYAFNSVGDYFQGYELCQVNGLTGGQSALKVLAHGAIGGLMADAGGGKFADGFWSAGASAAMSSFGGYKAMGVKLGGDPAHNAMVSYLVGGTISSATGGSFAAGGMAAMFGRMFNELPHWAVRNIQESVYEGYGWWPSDEEVRDMHVCKSWGCYILKEFFSSETNVEVEYKDSYRGGTKTKINALPAIDKANTGNDFDADIGINISSGPVKIKVSKTINIENAVDAITGGGANNIREHHRRLEEVR